MLGTILNPSESDSPGSGAARAALAQSGRGCIGIFEFADQSPSTSANTGYAPSRKKNRLDNRKAGISAHSIGV
jgi:hypothetical protein